MKKNRDQKTGQFIPTDYSSYIGQQFGCCILTKVYRYKSTKKAVLKCIYCGKEHNATSASHIFDKKYIDRECMCSCLGRHKDAMKKMRRKFYDESFLLKNNTSGWTGIYHITKSHGRPVDFYRAKVNHKGHSYYIGEFKDKMDAVQARRDFIKKKGWLDND